MAKDNLCKCTVCGYEWIRGKNGNHSCASAMTDTIRDLAEQLLESNKIRRIYEMGINKIAKVNAMDYEYQAWAKETLKLGRNAE